MRELYLPYRNGRFRFLAATCTEAHFFVVDITYNFHHPNMFENVTVYDSLRKTSRMQKGHSTALNPRTKAAQFLRCFQMFLAQYCFFQDMDMERRRLLMEEKPDLLLDTCTVAPCPQQQNGHDCGLFAFAILIHLAQGIEITDHLFTQSNISYFRKRIHEHLLSSKPAGRSRRVVGLGRRREEEPPATTAHFVSTIFAQIHTTTTTTTSSSSSNNDDDHPIENSLSDTDHQEDPVGIPSSPRKNESSPRKKRLQALSPELDEESSKQDNDSTTKKTDDLVFKQMFTSVGNDHLRLFFASTDEICVQILNYESVSGIRLVIKKGYGDARTYVCSSHVPCCFKAKFGPRRGKDNHIVLKENMSVLAHYSGGTARTTAADGRKLKARPRITKVLAWHFGGHPIGAFLLGLLSCQMLVCR